MRQASERSNVVDSGATRAITAMRAKKNTYSRTQYTEDPDNPAKVSDAQGEQLVVVAGY